MNDSNPIALNYNQNGIVNITLPQGPSYDEYRISIFVQIIDDCDAITVYNIPYKITVQPKPGLLEDVTSQLLGNQMSASSPFFKDLLSGDLNLCAKNIISMQSIANSQSNSLVRLD